MYITREWKELNVPERQFYFHRSARRTEERKKEKKRKKFWISIILCTDNSMLRSYRMSCCVLVHTQNTHIQHMGHKEDQGGTWTWQQIITRRLNVCVPLFRFFRRRRCASGCPGDRVLHSRSRGSIDQRLRFAIGMSAIKAAFSIDESDGLYTPVEKKMSRWGSKTGGRDLFLSNYFCFCTFCSILKQNLIKKE